MAAARSEIFIPFFIATTISVIASPARPATRDFGIGECEPRDEIGHPGTSPRKQSFADCLKCLPSGEVSELVAAGNLAGGVDLFGAGSEMGVDIDAVVGVDDTGHFEIEARHCGFSATHVTYSSFIRLASTRAASANAKVP